MLYENVFFESRFSLNDISLADIKKELYNLNSKKVETFGNTPSKVLKENMQHSS